MPMNMAPEICGIVLAAGSSIRFPGHAKLLQLVNGESIVHRTVRAYTDELDCVVVVTQTDSRLITRAIQDLAVAIASNPDYEKGMSTSMRVGLTCLPVNCAAAIIGVADQPLLSRQVIEAVVNRWRETNDSVVVPYYGGNPGNPSLYARSLFPALLAITGDVGGRSIRDSAAHQRVDIDPWWSGFDVDTPDDLELVEMYATQS